MKSMNTDYSKFKINQIANIIIEDWKNIDPHAKHYLEAMRCVKNINDKYGQDDAKSIVLYFLSSASNWSGQRAREIKKYLNKIVADNLKQRSVSKSQVYTKENPKHPYINGASVIE